MADLVFNNWPSGVAASPFVQNGFADMRNVSVDKMTGGLRLSRRLQQLTPPTQAGQTFTADAGTDLITVSTAFTYTQGNSTYTGTGRAVTLTTTGTLPAGLATSTTYFLIYVSNTTYQLASSFANSQSATAINITDAGTGTHTITPVNMGAVRSFAINPATGTIYAADSNGRVWFTYAGTNHYYLLTGNTLTGGEGRGIAVYKNYLFVFRNGFIDVYGSLASGSPAWTNGWKTINSGNGSGNPHHAIIGTDDTLYWTDDRYVGSLYENSGSTFDPATGGTFTYNDKALTIPSSYLATRIEQLGKYLQVVAYRPSSYETKVFPWDRTSASYQIPIQLPIRNVTASAQDYAGTYVAGGGEGEVYRTNNTTTELYFRLPEYLTSGFVSGNNCYINSMCVFQNKLYMSVYYRGISGLWTKDLATGVIVMTSKFSKGYGTTNGINSEAIIPLANNNLHVAWYYGDDETAGIDAIFADNYYYHSSYAAYAETDLRRVGVFHRKQKFTQMEIVLAKPLTTGQGVRVSYRNSLAASYSTPITFDTSVSTTLISDSFSFPADSSEHIQLKIELTTDSFAITTPEVLEVRLR